MAPWVAIRSSGALGTQTANRALSDLAEAGSSLASRLCTLRVFCASGPARCSLDVDEHLCDHSVEQQAVICTGVGQPKHATRVVPSGSLRAVTGFRLESGFCSSHDGFGWRGLVTVRTSQYRACVHCAASLTDADGLPTNRGLWPRRAFNAHRLVFARAEGFRLTSCRRIGGFWI